MDGTAFILFHDTTWPNADDLVEKTLGISGEHGFVAKEAGEPVPPREGTLSERKRIRLYPRANPVRDGVEFDFSVDDWEGPIDSVLNLTIPARQLQAGNSADEAGTPPEQFFDLIGDLAVDLEPYYVSSFNTYVMDGETGPLPPTVLPDKVPVDLERIPWLGIYSEPMLEHFGGRERVLATPAWRVEELENGSVMIITTREPWANYGEKHPADRYLLDGDDSATLEQPDPGLSDPFAALAPGEYGTDVCVYREDIASEFRNEDLSLVRVFVDQQGDLRRMTDESFVRNVVADPPADELAFVKAMLGAVPAAASDDQLMVSALQHEAIPPAFVRLDDPDGETVVSKVMGLDVETSKVDLLVSLGRAARHGGDDAPQKIMGALDTLADVERVEGVEEWIEDALL